MTLRRGSAKVAGLVQRHNVLELGDACHVWMLAGIRQESGWAGKRRIGNLEIGRILHFKISDFAIPTRA